MRRGLSASSRRERRGASAGDVVDFEVALHGDALGVGTTAQRSALFGGRIGLHQADFFDDLFAVRPLGRRIPLGGALGHTKPSGSQTA